MMRRYALGALAALAIALLFLLPLAAVFAEAFARGLRYFLHSIAEPDACAAIGLTLLVAAISVPLNTIFGLAASWAIARFEFRGKSMLMTLIDLPFSIPPVIAGLMIVLLYGGNGWLGAWLSAHHIDVVFAVPGLVLATLLVTLPYVARELIPVMMEQGSEEEEAAILLGAKPWQMLRRITLPKIRYALLTAVLLANARAMGEFGAVAVVPGHIRGETTTIPLYVEMLYNEYNFAAAFAVATLLALLGLVTLLAKSRLEKA